MHDFHTLRFEHLLSFFLDFGPFIVVVVHESWLFLKLLQRRRGFVTQLFDLLSLFLSHGFHVEVLVDFVVLVLGESWRDVVLLRVSDSFLDSMLCCFFLLNLLLTSSNELFDRQVELLDLLHFLDHFILQSVSGVT